MLELITGRDGTGKSRYLIDRARQCQLGGEKSLDDKIYFLVPEQFSLQCERDLIEGLNLQGTLTLEVLSLSRLASRVFDEVGGSTRVMMDEQGQIMLLRRIMEEQVEDLLFYKKSSPGLLGQLRLLVEAIKRNKIDMCSWQQAAKESGDERLSRKMSDASLLFGAYQEALAGEYIDPEEAYHLLKEKLPQSLAFRDKDIFIDGFSRFSLQGIEIIQTLLELGNRIHLALVHDTRRPEGGLFEEQGKLIDTLTRFCRRQGIEQKNIHLDHIYRPVDLAHLQTEIFAFPFETFPEKPSNLVVRECKDREEEVETLLETLSEMLEDESFRPADAAVICDDLSSYEAPLRRRFAAYDIPVYIDQTMPLIEDAFVRFLLLSMQAVASNFRQSTMRSHLSSGFLPMNLEEKEALENYLLAYGIDQSTFLTPFKAEDEAVDLEALRLIWIEPLLELQTALKSDTVRAQASGLYEYTMAVDCVEQLQERRQERLDERDYLQAGRMAQVYRAFLEVLEQMVLLLGDETLEDTAFMDLLETGLMSKTLPQIPSGLDQVLVGSLARSKSQDIKVLFLLGFNEGIIPKELTGFPLLAPHQLSQLASQGLDLGFDLTQRYRREKVDLLQALGKPSQRIYISYALVNADGEGLAESAYVRRIKKIFPSLVTEGDFFGGGGKDIIPLTLPAWPTQIKDRLRCIVSSYYQGHELDEPILSFMARCFKVDEGRDIERFTQAAFLRSPSVKLKAETSFKLYGESPPLSISRLQKMASCPFAHFISYGLKPRERRSGVAQASDIGSFFHDVLFRFGVGAERDGVRWTDLSECERDRRLDESIAESLKHPFQRAMTLDPSLARYRRMAQHSLATVIDMLSKGSLEPSLFEVTFGREGVLPPLLVQVSEDECWEIKGVIDRADLVIDESKEKALVRLIDYKSGNKDFDFMQFYHGINLQLPIYAQVFSLAQEVLDVGQVEVGCALYFHLDDYPVRSLSMQPQDIQAALSARFKMKGLILQDIEVVTQLEGGLLDTKDSETMHGVKIKKDGDFHKNAQLIGRDEWSLMEDHTLKKATELARQMASGEVGIHPYRLDKDLTPCTYCQYKAVCFYEAGQTEHRQLDKLSQFDGDKKARVMKKMEEDNAHMDARSTSSD